MEIGKILIAGAGQMGSGIAQVSAQAGYSVVMTDIDIEYVEKGIATIERNLGRAVDKGKINPEDRVAALSRIETGVDVSAGRDADLFIEAVPEDLSLKLEIFASAMAALGANSIMCMLFCTSVKRRANSTVRCSSSNAEGL